MSAVQTVQLPTNFEDLLARVRRGESLLLVEDGHPVAELTPPTRPDETAEPVVRGVFAPAVPSDPVRDFQVPDRATTLERAPVRPNFSWMRNHDDADE